MPLNDNKHQQENYELEYEVFSIYNDNKLGIDHLARLATLK